MAERSRAANLGKPISSEVIVIANNMEEAGRLADLAASNLDLKVEGAQEILEAIEPIERLRRVHELMAKELEVLAMQQESVSEEDAASGAKVAFITHVARERDIQATVADLRHLDDVYDIHSLLRVIG